MTREERIRYLKGLLKCELCEEESIKICKSCDNRRIGSSAKCYDALKEVIKALEQDPKKGHWIMTNDYLTTAYGSVDYVKCSCCGEDSLEEGNYCPNYGADMREVEE